MLAGQHRPVGGMLEQLEGMRKGKMKLVWTLVKILREDLSFFSNRDRPLERSEIERLFDSKCYWKFGKL